MKDWISRQVRSWGPVGFSWALVAAVVVLALFYIGGPHALEEGVDVLDPPAAPVSKELKEDLAAGFDADGDPLLAGPSQGASPNGVIARPAAFFLNQGTTFEWAASPNWAGRGSNSIDAIMVHVTAGGTCDGIVNYFKNPGRKDANGSTVPGSGGVASHFLVCPEKVVQQVEIADAAFHGGLWGSCINPKGNPQIAFWSANRINPNLKTVGIETLLKTGQQLNSFPTMRENLVDLLVYLTTELGLPADRQHIIGHFETDCSNRSSDPICCMDLDAVVAEVAARLNTPAPYAAAQIDLTLQRWVGAAAFFDEYAFSGRQGVNAAYDFGLPADVGLVEVEFFLRSGYATVWDGGSYPFGRACFVESKAVSRCTIALDAGGWFELEGAGVIDQLVITGAYRNSR